MTLDDLMQTFSYDPDTGVVTRLKAGGQNSRHIGKECRSKNGNGYFTTRYDGANVLVHRMAFALMTGVWPIRIVDHINGEKTDNRWCNLRECSKAENSQNRHWIKPTGSSGVRGVHWDKRFSKWKASIKANGRRYSLGSFDSKEAALDARMEASKRLHGSFAGIHVNFQESKK